MEMTAPATRRRTTAIAARHMLDPKVTQGDLAQSLGVSTTLVARIELGERTPSADLARRWADALAQPLAVVFPDVFPEQSDGAVAAAPVAAPNVDAGDGGAREA